MPDEIQFQKKELIIIAHNKDNLPTAKYTEFVDLQGDLKVLSKEKEKKLKKSIITYGIRFPAFIWQSDDKKYIVDAHQRKKVFGILEKEGWTIPEVPYTNIFAKNKKEAAELLLQANSRYGEINPKTSFFEDFEIDIGYLNEISIPELDLAFEDLNSKDIVEDEVPDVPEDPITQVGDLWVCGKHRVLCGDSAKAEDVERVMGGKKAQLCFTRPPYWVGKDYEKETSLEEVKRFIEKLSHSITKVVTKDGGRIVLNTSTARAQAINPKAEIETLFSLSWWQDAFRDKDWLMRHCRLWVKSGQLAARSIAPKSDVIDQHWETLATFLPTFYNPNGLRRGQERIKMKWAQQGVWDDIKGTANKNNHGAEFPVELPHRYIKLYSTNTELIFDPFLGSGTTLIAAEQLNRICYGMEIEPRYVDVIIERYHKLTGNDPIREDGKKWSELKSI